MKLLFLSALIAQLSLSTGLSPAEQLEQALALNEGQQGERANALLAELSEDPQTRRSLGLDLVEAWWRVAHRERAINTLSKWRQEAPRSPDPIVRARARILTGSPFDVDLFFESLRSKDAPSMAHCRLLGLAFSLDAVGQRELGQSLLERAWREVRCDNEDEVRALWERPRRSDIESGALERAKRSKVERYVLGPGNEAKVVKVMPEQASELPEGIGLVDLSIPETRVEALYAPLDASVTSCDEAPLCVSLHHPTKAEPGDRIIGSFALRTRGQKLYETEALLDGISTRIREQGQWEPWRKVSAPQESVEPASMRDEEQERASEGQEKPELSLRWGWLIAFVFVALAIVAKAARPSRPS